MKNIKYYLLSYKKRKLFINKLIMLWTRGKYSHNEIAIYDHESGTYDIYSSSAKDGGVRLKLIVRINEENWDKIELEYLDRDRLNEALRETQRCRYDWKGIIFSQVFKLHRQNKKKWYCSEWCAYALNITSNEGDYNCSPTELYKLVSKYRIKQNDGKEQFNKKEIPN